MAARQWQTAQAGLYHQACTLFSRVLLAVQLKLQHNLEPRQTSDKQALGVLDWAFPDGFWTLVSSQSLCGTCCVGQVSARSYVTPLITRMHT